MVAPIDVQTAWIVNRISASLPAPATADARNLSDG
jgi:hypothetical protein